MSRPTIAIGVPEGAHPGDEIEVEVNVQFDLAPRKVRAIDVIHAFWELTANEKEPAGQQTRVRVFDGGELGGRQHYVATLRIPEDATTTHAVAMTEGWHTITVHVDLPWAFDAEETIRFDVTPRPRMRPEPVPIIADTAGGIRPRIEMALADETYAAGETIRGTIAVSDLGGRHMFGIEVSLLAVSEDRDARGLFKFRGETSVAVTFIPMADEEPPGKVYPFALAIPIDTLPSGDARRISRRYQVVARIDGPSAKSAIDVNIGVFSPSKGDRARSEVPDVGLTRWRSFLREIVEPFGLALHRDKPTVSGKLGVCRVTVRGAGDGDGQLEAALDFPTWSMALHIRSSAIRSDSFSLDARDDAQARALFSRPLRDALLVFDEFNLRDSRVVVTEAGSIGDPDAVRSFIGRVDGLADAITNASAQLPPPTKMQGTVDDWASFAQTIDGTLHRGNMSIRGGTIDGCSIAILTTFDKKALGTQLRLALAQDTGARFGEDEKMDAVPPAAHDVLQRLRGRARLVTIDGEAIVVDVSSMTPDPEQHRDTLRTMIELARAIGVVTTAGPYR